MTGMLGIEHGGYILAAWGVATVVLIALTFWILADHRTLRATLERLETRGLRRRSDARQESRHQEGKT